MQAVVFLGPPGAGKGTQAKGEAERRGLLYIATGDQLRAAVAAGTELGLQAKACMDSGELVPDDVIIGIVRELIAQHPDAEGVLFDGFPRTAAQADALGALMSERGASITAVVYFDVAADAVVRRLGGRRVCRGCGTTYHTEHLRPKQEGTCDQCGGELYQRDDDNETTVRERLRVYEDQTASLLDYYRSQDLLVRIDAAQSIDDVAQAVKGALDGAGG
ncbi:adenylate kinase [bacterium]|nr:adenylate kinase [bacterium]